MNQKTQSKLVLLVSRVTKEDDNLTGAGYRHMATLFDKGIPLPPSFCVTGDAFRYLLEFGGVGEEIKKMVSKNMINRRRIEKLVFDCKFPPVLRNEVVSAYKRIGGFSEPHVLVIPYAFTKQSTLPLKEERRRIAHGDDAVINTLKKCWVSLLFDNISRLDEILKGEVRFGVMIVKLPLEEVSGMMYTTDIATNNQKKLCIEAAYGMWEIVDQEGFVPDQYVYDKLQDKVIDKHISKQPLMFIRQLARNGDAGLSRVEISSRWQSMQKLDDKHLKHLARIGKVLERYFGESYEVGWVYEGGKVWILWLDPIHKHAVVSGSTARVTGTPITIVLPEAKPEKPVKKTKPKSKKIPKEFKEKASKLEVIARGIGNKEGVASGTVVKDVQAITSTKEPVLVTTVVTEKELQQIHTLKGLVVDKGGKTSPAFAVASMKGVPTVGDTAIATKTLETGQKVSIDSVKGIVYAKPKTAKKTEKSASDTSATKKTDSLKKLKARLKYDRTATKILSVGFIDCADQLSDMGVVKVSRADGLKTRRVGAWIGSFIVEGKPVFVKMESEKNLRQIAKQVFKLRTAGARNISIILPAYAEPKDIAAAKKNLLSAGLRRSSTFDIFATVGYPGTIFGVDELLKIGVDGLWVDAAMLQEKLTGRKISNLKDETVKAIVNIADRINSEKLTTYFDVSGLQVKKPLLEEIVNSGIMGIGVDSENMLVRMRNMVGGIERSRIMGK